MNYYILKTPGVEGYLNEENIELESIPYIITCRKQSTIPKLVLIEKSSALTKKVYIKYF